MEMRTVIAGGRATLSLAGKMTVQTAPRLGEAVDALPNEVCDIDVDLGGVDYVSSAGLRALLVASRAATDRGGAFRLLHPRPAMCEVLDMAELTDVLHIEP